MGDEKRAKNRNYGGGIPKERQEELIEAAAKQAADLARTQMRAVLATKEVGRLQALRRADVQVKVNVPSLGESRRLAWDGPIIADKDPRDGVWLLDDNPTDTVVYGEPDGDVWWADMTNSTDPV